MNILLTCGLGCGIAVMVSSYFICEEGMTWLWRASALYIMDTQFGKDFPIDWLALQMVTTIFSALSVRKKSRSTVEVVGFWLSFFSTQ